ncbi:MAG: HAD hydrolase family protein [Vampirovibrionales bacterium]|nr:HAD hydrolase family protein [Vampirovibrionales bacterium]
MTSAWDEGTRLHEAAKEIRLLVFDVDGVLTNGQLWYGPEDAEFKAFNVKDGQGIAWWNQLAGRQSIIITARSSEIVRRRGDELGVAAVFEGQKNKWACLQTYLSENNLALNQVAYMGDDWPDIACLQHVGLATCPVDAVAEVQSVCDWVASLPGGQGAVRDLINRLCEAQGLLPQFV